MGLGKYYGGAGRAFRYHVGSAFGNRFLEEGRRRFASDGGYGVRAFGPHDLFATHLYQKMRKYYKTYKVRSGRSGKLRS